MYIIQLLTGNSRYNNSVIQINHRMRRGPKTSPRFGFLKPIHIHYGTALKITPRYFKQAQALSLQQWRDIAAYYDLDWPTNYTAEDCRESFYHTYGWE